MQSRSLDQHSLTTDISGTVVAQTRYLPYGEERWTAGDAQPTDFTYTGQRVERGFGLMDYKARYYDPRLGRFVSADTVVPEYENPQSIDRGNPQLLNRYSYVIGNPLKLSDPTGNRVEGEWNCNLCDIGLVDPPAPPEPPEPPQPPEPPKQESQGILEDWNLYRGGFRVEGSFMLIFGGGDANLDIMWDIPNRDARFFLGAGVQGGFGLLASVNAGPILTRDLAHLDGYENLSNNVGVTVSDDAFLNILGIEPNYVWSDVAYEGQKPEALFIGVVGGGEEVAIWYGRQLIIKDVTLPVGGLMRPPD